MFGELVSPSCCCNFLQASRAWDFNGVTLCTAVGESNAAGCREQGKSSTTGNGRGPFLGAQRSAKLAEKMAKSWRRNVIQKVVWSQTVWNPSRETSSLLHKPRTIGKATQRGSPINQASFLPRHRHGASTNRVVPAKVWKDGPRQCQTPSNGHGRRCFLFPSSPSPPCTSLETWVLGPWVPPPGGAGAACSSSRFNRCVLDLGPQRFGPKP